MCHTRFKEIHICKRSILEAKLYFNILIQSSSGFCMYIVGSHSYVKSAKNQKRNYLTLYTFETYFMITSLRKSKWIRLAKSDEIFFKVGTPKELHKKSHFHAPNKINVLLIFTTCNGVLTKSLNQAKRGSLD